MTKNLKILGVHGLGDHRNSTWKETWSAAIKKVFPITDGLSIDFGFTTYDDIFEDTEITFAESAKALWKLTKSGISTAVVGRQRGVISDVSDKIRWTAGYVVAWVEDAGFQKKSRKRVLDDIRDYEPDIIVAHSLGSLITYNAFSHPDAEEEQVSRILRKAKYITIGSQIGNPFVIRNLTMGRIEPLPVAFWHHLYNVHDDVFTAPLKLWNMTDFSQTDTPFDIEGFADHAAEEYLTHRNTVENVWRPLGEEAINIKSFGPAKSARSRLIRTPAEDRRPRRALLVGINDYPDEASRLEGCVNDVFTMSSVLQECGFEPESIRTCLDKRATAEGIRKRLEWLLDDARPGDERIFYYSGHGARMPEYGENYEPDRHLEALVPWDFDWSAEKAITDDQIFMLYSQLPFKVRLIMIFDCCHSGGIHRDGAARVRGITPPDDVRHRELKWDRETQMWVSRNFKRINKNFSSKGEVNDRYFGKNGATERLGRAAMLRGISSNVYERIRKAGKDRIVGPYLPLIIEACGEDQYSYEYRHGVTSHGAFTYCLSKLLRQETSISFERLVKLTREQLRDLQYDQEPQILGPTSMMRARVPWRR